MRSKVGLTRRLAVFLSFVIGLLVVMCFGSSAEATTKFVEDKGTQALGLLASMGHDPDAVDCLRQACLTVPFQNETERHVRIEACKQDHLARVRSAISQGTSRLRAMSLSTSAMTPDRLTCEAFTGQREPSFEETADAGLLGETESRLASLKARIQPNSSAVAQTGSGTKVSATVPASVKTASPRNRKHETLATVEDELHRADGKYAGLVGPDKMGIARCAPDHFVVRRSDDSSAEFYVEQGAAYDELARSCVSKTFKTGAVEVVEANPVEATVPACIMPNGTITLDPTRYSEILSGRRKLELGGKPNLEFHKECVAKGGKPWVSLQPRGILKLAAKGTDDVSRDRPSAEVAKSGVDDRTIAKDIAAVVTTVTEDGGQQDSVPVPVVTGALAPAGEPPDASVQPDVSSPAKVEETDAEPCGGWTSQPMDPAAPVDEEVLLDTGQGKALALPWSLAFQGMRRKPFLLRATSPPGMADLGLCGNAACPDLHCDHFGGLHRSRYELQRDPFF